ncbi:MAG: DNA polymerase alpha/epsilon subunit B-domain-containing protein [Monoraphidium minutum]|nr:MAG: DNA polymerase alpha/epsilon subunit B-domain-containing protein [Monoraphidium minutum]
MGYNAVGAWASNMAGSCTDADVRRALGAVAVRCADGALLARLSQAAQQNGLTAKALATRYSAFTINSDDEKAVNRVTPGLVDGFLAQLQRDLAGAARAAPRAGGGGAGAGAAAPLADTALPKSDQKQPPSTPPARGAAGAGAGGSPLTPQSVPRSAFKERANGGQVVSVFNEHVPAAAAPHSVPLRPEPLGRQLPARYTFMMERPEDKVAAIDARIVEGRQRLAEALGEEFGEPVPIGQPVQEDAWFVGRVVPDADGGAHAPAPGGGPAAGPLALEGDAASSGGARAALDLSLVAAARLFPGQVVGVRGFNPTGGRIVARRVVTHAPPPAADASAAGAASMEVDGGGGGGGGGGVAVAVAAGPFTTADDPTGFAPLDALLAALGARAAPPALLVLLGPFVDVEQPAVAAGALDVTFQSLFTHQVLARLAAWQERLPAPCQAVLLPSPRDAHAMPTFPQPPLTLPPAMDCAAALQNPALFDAGGLMVVGATSTDALRHLAGAELQRGPHADRLAALASHLLGQRSFYPLFPAAPGACLDTTADAALAMPVLPDLLLLPSDLAPFAKAVPAGGPYPECAAAPAPAAGEGGAAAAAAAAAARRVLVVNPGRLVKGSSGGTYAVLTLPAGGAAAAGSGGLAAGCRVEIVRV